jgi:hypothetical protein
VYGRQLISLTFGSIPIQVEQSGKFLSNPFPLSNTLSPRHLQSQPVLNSSHLGPLLKKSIPIPILISPSVQHLSPPIDLTEVPLDHHKQLMAGSQHRCPIIVPQYFSGRLHLPLHQMSHSYSIFSLIHWPSLLTNPT